MSAAPRQRRQARHADPDTGELLPANTGAGAPAPGGSATSSGAVPRTVQEAMICDILGETLLARSEMRAMVREVSALRDELREQVQALREQTERSAKTLQDMDTATRQRFIDMVAVQVREAVGRSLKEIKLAADEERSALAQHARAAVKGAAEAHLHVQVSQQPHQQPHAQHAQVMAAQRLGTQPSRLRRTGQWISARVSRCYEWLLTPWGLAAWFTVMGGAVFTLW
jgi:hypothetical protein